MAKKFLYTDANMDYTESPGAFEISDHISSFTGEPNEPIVTDSDGYIDASLIDISKFSHGDLDGLDADDHLQYILVDGTRAFTGDQSMGGNMLTDLASPVNANDAARKAYVDAVAQGLRPKGNVRVATTEDIDLASAPASIDNVTLDSGDRVLVWQQDIKQENGIYIFNGAASVMTRSPDQDNDPLAEIVNGVFIPKVLEGDTYEGEPFVLFSVGTGTEGMHIIGTDEIEFELFTSPTRLQPGLGIDFDGNIVNVDLLDTDSGLAFLGIGNDELAIDWSTSFDDAKAIKAEDLSSNNNGLGASIIGIEDAGNWTNETNVEGSLQELYFLIAKRGTTYTAGAGGVSAGDLVYISSADTILPMTVNLANKGIGIALETKGVGEEVTVLANDTIIEGVLDGLGATVGQKIFWNNGLSLTAPVGGGSYVYMVGIAKNTTDLHVEVKFIKRNS